MLKDNSPLVAGLVYLLGALFLIATVILIAVRKLSLDSYAPGQWFALGLFLLCQANVIQLRCKVDKLEEQLRKTNTNPVDKPT